MRHRHFARGWADIRAGRPFDPDIDDDYWAYERGRLLGAIAPLAMELFHGKTLNPRPSHYSTPRMIGSLLHDR